jgi:hypothetical protein
MFVTDRCGYRYGADRRLRCKFTVGPVENDNHKDEEDDQ